LVPLVEAMAGVAGLISGAWAGPVGAEGVLTDVKPAAPFILAVRVA